ncbi:MAG: 2-phospho-L-lactate guanylyltransferase [Dehalococcoidia bacterium]
MRIALIPVKDLSEAKARLASVLDAAGRRELALAMFRDVLAAARACSAFDGVAVVTRDEEALAIAEAAGVEGLAEAGSLNEALTSASEAVAQRGAERIVVLAADLPFVTADEITVVAKGSADVVVAAAKDGGTNALALAPGAIAFRFGRESAGKHIDAARKAKLQAVRIESPCLAFDVDTPEDLRALREAIDSGRRAGRHTDTLFRTASRTG